MKRADVFKYRDKIKDTVTHHTLTHSSVTVGANSASVITIQVPSNFDFQWFAISGKSTSALYTLQITEVGGDTRINNNLIHSNAIVGNGNLPYPLPHPMLLRRRGGIKVDVSDLSGVANTIQLTLHGIAYYDESRAMKIVEEYEGMMPFIYTTDTAPVSITAANTDTSATINIDKGRDFLIIQESYFDNSSSSGLLMKLFGASGRQMQNDVYMDVRTTMGGAQYPRKFRQPTIFYGGNVINITVKDTAGSNSFYYAMAGITILK